MTLVSVPLRRRLQALILKQAIEATENTEDTENTQVSRRITLHQNGASVKVRNLLLFLCDLCVLCG